MLELDKERIDKDKKFHFFQYSSVDRNVINFKWTLLAADVPEENLSSFLH